MTTAVAQSVDTLSRNLDLSASELARIVGASVRSVQRWSTGQAAPQHDTKERLLELVAVSRALADVIRPDDANLWLYTPNPLLGFDKPADRIARGDWRDVIAAIEALADGVFV